MHLLIKPASSLCNMRCRYCFYCDVSENRHTASYGIMQPDVTEAMIRNVFTYAAGPVSFAFQGGEPTLAGEEYYRHFHDMVDLYNTKNFPVTYAMQTNGYHLSEGLLAMMAEKKYLLGISLDGMGKLHDSLRQDVSGEGTFKRINENLKRIEQFGIDYNILCVVTETIAAHGAEVYRYFRSRNFGYLQFIPYVPDFDREKEKHSFTLTNERYARFLNTVFRLYYDDFCRGKYISIRQFDNFIRLAARMPAECCGMDGICHTNLVVEADGSVFPCDFYMLDPWKLGNIMSDPVDQLFTCDKAKAFVACSEPVPEKCRKCQCYPVCRNGCRRHRENRSGEGSLNRYCDAYRTFFTENRTLIMDMASRCFSRR